MDIASYIKNNRYHILINVILVAASLIIPIIIQTKTNSDKYEENTLQRPCLKLVYQPQIDSIVFVYDSLGILEYFNYVNNIRPNLTMHNAYPTATIYYSLMFKNNGNSLTIRTADIYTDTISDEFLMREKMFEAVPEVSLYNNEEPRNVPIEDSLEIKFQVEIQREQIYFHGVRGRASIHNVILYENERGVLFDTYLILPINFEYPDNTIISRRSPLRIINSGATKVITKGKAWFRGRIIQDTKIYKYEEATDLLEKFMFYYKNVFGEKKYNLGT